MDRIESRDIESRSTLDRIAHNIETIAGLRGDSDIYQDTRPTGLTVYQKEMYDLEDSLRSRLMTLGYQYQSPRSLADTV